MLLYTLFEFINKIFPAKRVFAHCDIPCGIYTPEPAKTAAQTILKMTEKIQAQPLPNWQDPASVQQYENAISRYVLVKEEHARKCKEELLILWTDYFKPEHLAMFPDLHDKFWKATKLCSRVKQEVNLETAQQLNLVVKEIAEMFYQAEKAKTAK